MKKIILIVILGMLVIGCVTLSESEDAIIKRGNSVNLEDGVSKREAIIIAQKCLIESEYRDEYDYSKYMVNYDKGEFPFTNLWKFGRPAWLVEFKSDNKNDQCMYGAVIFEDGKENICGCMYGM